MRLKTRSEILKNLLIIIGIKIIYLIFYLLIFNLSGFRHLIKIYREAIRTLSSNYNISIIIRANKLKRIFIIIVIRFVNSLLLLRFR